MNSRDTPRAEPSEAELLAVLSQMSEFQKRAAIRMIKRLGEGQSTHATFLSFLLECDMDQTDAERIIATLPPQAFGAGK